MEKDETKDASDASRRRFLTTATTIVAGIGVGLAAFPFLRSWAPSERARALGAPVEVDISKIEAGQKITVPWRGKPIFVVNRTSEELSGLSKVISHLRDPNSAESEQPAYAKNAYRSIKEKILVEVARLE